MTLSGTSDPGFKVMTFFEVELSNILKTKCTIGNYI